MTAFYVARLIFCNVFAARTGGESSVENEEQNSKQQKQNTAVCEGEAILPLVFELRL